MTKRNNIGLLKNKIYYVDFHNTRYKVGLADVEKITLR
jgi:hypothetical protein